MSTGIFRRAAVSQHGIEFGIVELQTRAVGLLDRQAEALHDFADAERTRLDVGLELRGDLLPRARDRRSRRSSPVNITIRPL